MPLQLPNLDDRTYTDLVAEALHLIPTYAPDWTNYNPSDPGITLLEVFAYLTELLIYRLNQVTDENKIAFLKLINGPDWSLEKPLDEAIRDTVQTLRQSDRAITTADFEALAHQADTQVARARCLPRINLISDRPTTPTERPGYLSMLIVRGDGPLSSQQVLDKVTAYLEPRRLLTTRISVVEPQYLAVQVQVRLILQPDAIEKTVAAAAIQKLTAFFDPLKGGQQGQGWEFGRAIYISEIYELLDELDGVDYVESARDATTGQALEEVTTRNARDGDRRQFTNGQLMAIAVYPNELVNFQSTAQTIQFPSATAKTPGGLR